MEHEKNKRKKKEAKSKPKKEVKHREKKKEVHQQLDPKVDLNNIKYEEVCDVTVIQPIVFEEDGTIKDPALKKKTPSGKGIRGSPEQVINTGNQKKKEEEKKKEEKKEDPDLKGATVIQISIGGKKGHPWESRIEGQLCMVANRVPGGPLTLEKGKKYVIHYIGKEGSGYEMILTRDPVGGKNAPLLDGTSSIPVSQQRLLTLNKECPNNLYYQDRNKEFLGGSIIVK